MAHPPHSSTHSVLSSFSASRPCSFPLFPTVLFLSLSYLLAPSSFFLPPRSPLPLLPFLFFPSSVSYFLSQSPIELRLAFLAACVAKDALDLLVLLPPPHYWEYKHEAPCSVFLSSFPPIPSPSLLSVYASFFSPSITSSSCLSGESAHLSFTHPFIYLLLPIHSVSPPFFQTFRCSSQAP